MMAEVHVLVSFIIMFFKSKDHTTLLFVSVTNYSEATSLRADCTCTCMAQGRQLNLLNTFLYSQTWFNGISKHITIKRRDACYLAKE